METGIDVPRDWMFTEDFRRSCQRFISDYRGSLGLSDWDIRVGDPAMFDYTLCEEGYIIRQDDERVATIYVHPEADRWQINRIVVHEMLHIVLSDMEFVACNGATIDEMELYQRFQERAIGQLTSAISGIDVWQPIVDCEKDAHAPGYNITGEDAG